MTASRGIETDTASLMQLFLGDSPLQLSVAPFRRTHLDAAIAKVIGDGGSVHADFVSNSDEREARRVQQDHLVDHGCFGWLVPHTDSCCLEPDRYGAEVDTELSSKFVHGGAALVAPSEPLDLRH